MNFSSLNDTEFIERLSKVVEANLADENFGVNELATCIKLSRTQLHRKLKAIRNQSASHFIREIRLIKAREMLQDNVGTVSEIAYKVGFGSPSYFIKCFHDFYGCSPGVLMKLPAGEAIEFRDPSDSNLKPSKRKIILSLILGLASVVLLAVLILLVSGYLSSNSEAGPTDKSLAVLPLKNLSDNRDIQYLADGIMEDILNRLSKVHDLKVKSRISSEQYRQPEMSVPKIAREMKVSYVLEGSIMNQEDKVRIYVQLIDAKSDNHIWSQEYNQDLTDILDITTEVSRQIARELQLALTNKEANYLGKNYTTNREAYNLYLKGRFFWSRRTEEDLLKSILYFEQVIENDENFSLGYAGLADAYYISAWWGFYPRVAGFEMSKRFAQKALELDNELAEVHATLGGIATFYDWDWKSAEEELRMAIALNPNYASGYQYYAEFLDILGEKEAALNMITKAMELNPNVSIFNYIRGVCEYKNGNFGEALNSCNKSLEISTMELPLWIKFYIHLKQGEDVLAIAVLNEVLTFLYPEDNPQRQIRRIHDRSDMKEVLLYTTEWLKDHGYQNDYRLAELYALAGEEQIALDYLELGFEHGNNRIPRMNSNPEFTSISQDPRFIALLEKMNLIVD
ncbi:helix-turn-helix domain-containing protein [Robertkochia solimangrovi]|uniref:helix-turn-helix domain-containing protein n=1 Tax=Robertkochia solimangrovi TaxID=2213046 RepID=UPI00117C4065|nr:helix-turn-helix domain-containing protein [Robertkochia solimangrovi]TRZ41828.1 hypothetical protein DMZ48_15900 [Robertkochia solimangrovi]